MLFDTFDRIRRRSRQLLGGGMAVLVVGLMGGVPARACDLALLLAVDVSSSVDPVEHDLQRRGLAAALIDPDVVTAILSGGGVWISSFEWSGRYQHAVHVDWTYLDGPDAIRTVSTRIRDFPRSHDDYPTAMGYALGFAAVHFRRLPQACARRVLDIAGDGVNNEGFGPGPAYRAFDFDRITVNGLVVKGSDPDPEEFYRSEVIRGLGAFVEIASDYSDYARAMRRKLIREVSGATLAMESIR